MRKVQFFFFFFSKSLYVGRTETQSFIFEGQGFICRQPHNYAQQKLAKNTEGLLAAIALENMHEKQQYRRACAPVAKTFTTTTRGMSRDRGSDATWRVPVERSNCPCDICLQTSERKMTRLCETSALHVTQHKTKPRH